MTEFDINMHEIFNQKINLKFSQPPACGSHGGNIGWLRKELYIALKKIMWDTLSQVGFQWEEFLNFVDDTEKGRGIWNFIGRSGFCKGKVYIVKSRFKMNTVEDFSLEVKMFEGRIYENMENAK